MKALSVSTVPIDVMGLDNLVISKASGFFYESERFELFLITNWHVVTGRTPTKPTMTRKGAIPRALRCKLHSRQTHEHSIRVSELMQYEVTINSSDGNMPVWLEHPNFRYRVDVVAIKIEDDRETLEKRCYFQVLNRDSSFETRYAHQAMDDVFVVGYPWGLSGSGGALPIYKRGSIASEPAIDYLGLPRFLIDCRTSSAMSGSPVLVEHSGVWNPNGKMADDSIFGTIINFIGVYSGRLISQDGISIEDEVSEIGIVWKKDALEAIVNSGVSGTTLADIASSNG
jgi:hypothetical protein